MVKPSILNKLINEGAIKTFLRSGKWATLGIDPLRESGGKYEGPERREYVYIFQDQ